MIACCFNRYEKPYGTAFRHLLKRVSIRKQGSGWLLDGMKKVKTKVIMGQAAGEIKNRSSTCWNEMNSNPDLKAAANGSKAQKQKFYRSFSVLTSKSAFPKS